MAAAGARRLSAVCRHFQRVINVSPPNRSLVPLQTPNSYQLCLLRQREGVPGLHWPTRGRFVHTSCTTLGLGQFFDLPENWGEATVKSGAPWTAKQLRAKSNEDLHKLWYVLLKEKNMLLTVEQESRRQSLAMPSPERVKKVDRSMRRLDIVVKEREDALRLLQTGQEKGRPGEWRRNVFGKTFWYRFREHPIPWYMNKIYKRKRFYTPSFVVPYTRLSLEKHLRSKTRDERRRKQNQKKLAEVFSRNATQARAG